MMRFHVARPTRGQSTAHSSAPGNIPVSVHSAARGTQQFQPLPAPTGAAPYRLSLDQVLPAATVQAIQKAGKIVFHMVGDTGGVKYPVPQQIVAMKLEEQFGTVAADNPAFFFHLGDVIYYNGEADKYFDQFYDPYVHYPAPIFAIPGNHDGEPIDSSVPSLDAYMRNFCAPKPQITPEAGESNRDAMIQPNCYFTLEAPFVTIVGLYTNVPEGGVVEDDQKAWLAGELAAAPKDKALLVAMHHPIYSADTHHSGSLAMKAVLEEAIAKSKRIPDAVFAAHVHNYQRFTRKEDDGSETPYIVAGGGGYWHLHYVGTGPDGSAVIVPAEEPEMGVTLESYSDNRHGFLRLTVTAGTLSGDYYTVPQPQEGWRSPAARFDAFTVDLGKHRLVPSRLDTAT